MEYTQNYQLPLWDKEDAVKRTDFNENNQKIDACITAVKTEAANALATYKSTNDAAVTALVQQMTQYGNCKIETGNYTGNGTYGKDNPTTLTFGFEPQMVVIWKNEYRPASTGSTVTRVGHWSPYFVILLPHVELMHTCVGSSDSSLSCLSFSGNTVQVYNTSSAALQWNGNNNTYYYIAIG